MSGGERELPEGWVIAPLGELGESSLGKMLDKAKWTTGTPLPYLRNLNVRWGHFALDELYEMPFEDHELDRYAVREGDLLVCEGGEPGRCAIWQGSEQTMMFQKALHRVRPSAALDARYIRYELEHAAQTQALDELFTGTTIKHLTGTSLAKFQVCLPPLNEQRRIVAKIEALTERSRRAKEALDAIPPLLDKLRQSILAAAFRGDLTKDWRAANPDVEPASELLKRIREERRRRWEEAELAKMKAKGKTPTDDTWKARYKEPEPVDTTGLPELPEGWAWASVEEVTVNFDGVRVPVKREDRAARQGRFPYYGASGVIDCIDGYLFDGDYLLVAEDGANLLSRSTPIAFQARGRFWVNNHAHVVDGCGVPNDYLESFLNGLDLSRYVSGTAQPKLTQKNFERIPVPVPPAKEISRIVNTVGNALASVASLRTIVKANNVQRGAMDSAILAKAFRGELVSQDPNDEPAAALLERIRAGQATAAPKKKARGKDR